MSVLKGPLGQTSRAATLSISNLLKVRKRGKKYDEEERNGLQWNTATLRKSILVSQSLAICMTLVKLFYFFVPSNSLSGRCSEVIFTTITSIILLSISFLVSVPFCYLPHSLQVFLTGEGHQKSPAAFVSSSLLKAKRWLLATAKFKSTHYSEHTAIPRLN